MKVANLKRTLSDSDFKDAAKRTLIGIGGVALVVGTTYTLGYLTGYINGCMDLEKTIAKIDPEVYVSLCDKVAKSAI